MMKSPGKTGNAGKLWEGLGVLLELTRALGNLKNGAAAGVGAHNGWMIMV
jgi:hypothetical protein